MLHYEQTISGEEMHGYAPTNYIYISVMTSNMDKDCLFC